MLPPHHQLAFRAELAQHGAENDAAVRRIDDTESATYKTDGYCAPELASDGPSISSDLYTVARTLAVLTFNFDYLGKFDDHLPDPADVPLLAANASYYRLLSRATDPNPDARFESASDMSDQLIGVLREVMSAEDGQPRSCLHSHTISGRSLSRSTTAVVRPS